MRPNVDIPWSLHGHVRELAERQDLTIEEAYCHVIRRGLRQDHDVVEAVVAEVLPEIDEFQQLQDDVDDIYQVLFDRLGDR